MLLRVLSVSLAVYAGLHSLPAFAACATPTGTAGDIIYNNTYDVLQYCNGTNWINAGGLNSSGGAMTSGNFCTYSGSLVVCNTGYTGTGNVVLSASPTITGTLAGASSTWSGTVAGAGSTWTGSVAIGTTTTSGALNVVGTVTATAFSGSGASLTGIGTSGLGGITGTPSSSTYLRGDGTWATVTGGTTTGTGTTNYIPLWTGTSVLGNSNLSQNVNGVGVGTTSINWPLDVGGSIHGTANLILSATNPSIYLYGDSSSYYPAINFYGLGNTSTIRGQVKLYAGVGMYYDSEGTHVFRSIAGTEFLRISSTGSLGIGTTTPASALSVNGGAAIGTYSGTTAAPSNGMIVSGNVGIGTASPSSALDIGPSQALRIEGYDASQVGIWFPNGGAIRTGTSGSYVYMDAGNFVIRDGNGSNSNTVVRISGGLSTGVGYWNTSPPSNGIIAQGSVGIGTTTPASALSVNGGAAIGTYSGTTAAPSNGLIVSGNIGIGTASPQSMLHMIASGNDIRFGYTSVGLFSVTPGGFSVASPPFYIDNYGQLFTRETTINNQNTANPNLSIRASSGQTAHMLDVTGYGASAGNLFNITSSGNVGIGTATPLNTLDVYSGGIHLGSSTPSSTTNALYAIGTSLMWNGAAVGSGSSGSSMTTTTMMSGWPDAIMCGYDTSPTSPVILYLVYNGAGVHTYNGNAGTGSTIGFNSDGSYNSTYSAALASSGTYQCVNKSVTQLYSTGQAFNFIGTGSVTTFNAGSAATPGFAVTSNTTTGLYQPATNVLAVSTNGSERLRIDSSGNVGIGTTSPTSSAKLHLVDGTYPGLKIERTGAYASGWRINAGQAAAGDFAIIDDAAGSSRMYINSTGNVGIGTTSPNTNLSVYNTGYWAGSSSLTNTGINITTNYTANTYTPGLFWSDNNDNPTKPKAGISVYQTGGGTYLYLYTSNNYANGITSNTSIGPSGEVFTGGYFRSNMPGTYGASASVCFTGTGIFDSCVSLRKYKTDIQPLSLGLGTALKLQPVSYTWKSTGEKDIGFIAEDATAIDPRFGQMNTSGKLAGIKYDHMIAVAIKAIQELKALFDSDHDTLMRLKADNDRQAATLKADEEMIRALRRDVDSLRAARH